MMGDDRTVEPGAQELPKPDMQLDRIRPRRSFLFVPGSGLDKFPKAVATGADIVCIDLEDAISPAHKAGARDATVARFVSDLDFGRSEVLVRINSLRTADGPADMLPVIEKTFSPTPEKIAHARRCIAAFEEAGTGLVVIDNKLLKKPVLRSMYRVLAIADALAE